MQTDEMDNGNLELKIAVSRGASMAFVDNVTMKWRALVAKLEHFEVDPLTLEQFKEKSKDWQNDRKQSAGYFIGGQMADHRRNKTTMKERQVLTYDIDVGNRDLLRQLRMGVSGLGDIEYVVHSTRTHGGGAIKLRLIIPLAKLIPKDDFQAIVRVGAWYLDPKMEAVDPVSFRPEQIMYWPAHCKGVEPIFVHNRGKLLDPYAMLHDWGGDDVRWRDISTLPRSPRQDRILHANMGSLHQDPLTKRGPVGAFCRTWDVHEAIAEFLPHIYEPSAWSETGEPDRYTYIPGTGGNGLVVYATGHVMSHHGSDPLSEMNVNAYDMVRVHLFGHLDKPGDEEKDPRQWPSYKAMEKMLLEYPEYVRELRDSQYGLSEEDADEMLKDESVVPPVTAEATSTEDNWRDRFDTNEKGVIKPTQHNILLILRHSNTFRGRLAYNEFTHMSGFALPLRSKSLGINFPIPKREGFLPLQDHHVTAIRHILDAPRGPKRTGWSLRVPRRDLEQAIDLVCRENPVHPVRDHLEWLVWDGIPRLETLWIKACHTPDTPYFRAASRNFLVASVARIYTPGTKFDFMPVLVGLTGIRKTSMVRILGTPRWTTTSEGHYDNKQKFVEASLGFWFIEHGELQHFRRAADEEGIKSILSGTHDTVRLSYRRNSETFARQFVVVGTTEDTQFLRSYHRRIWPIPCGDQMIDTAWLEANRDQLFAEAVVAWRELTAKHDPMELPLDLRGNALSEFLLRQPEHLLPDNSEALAGLVEEFLDTQVMIAPGQTEWGTTDESFENHKGVLVQRSVTCGLEIFVRVLGGDQHRFDSRAGRFVGDIMRHLQPEWQLTGQARCGHWGRQKTYRRTGQKRPLR